jgi:hypothetical protein
MTLAELTLAPEVLARRELAGRALRLHVLRPPYPALGVGILRVLRIRDDAAEASSSALELTVGYERYERLD